MSDPTAARGERAVSATTTALTTVTAAHNRRLRELDPLLPEAAVPDHGVGTTVLASLVERSAAMGVATRRAEEPGAPNTLWGPLRSYRLDVRLAGERRAEPLDDVLRQWHELRTRTAEPGDTDSAAIVSWPSHDVVGPAVLASHGFAPVGLIAARRARALPSGPPTPPGTPRSEPLPSSEPLSSEPLLSSEPAGSVRVRLATAADLDTMTAFAVALHRYDAQFGAVMDRDGADAVLRPAVEAGLAHQPRWSWIAETDQGVCGFVQVQRPDTTAWIDSHVAVRSVAYLGLMYVTPQTRRAGVGAALVATAHRAVDEAGVAVTLLHHAIANPTSAPFWARHGYRPLWTEWRRRPAI